LEEMSLHIRDIGVTKRLQEACEKIKEAMMMLNSNKDKNVTTYSSYFVPFTLNCGPGSSVGIATDYGLDCPGSSPGGDEIFRPSRPALGPTQPPVKWLPDLLQG